MYIMMTPGMMYNGRHYNSPALTHLLIEYTRATICEVCDELNLLPTDNNLRRIAFFCAEREVKW
jgi:hypothetical protein